MERKIYQLALRVQDCCKLVSFYVYASSERKATEALCFNGLSQYKPIPTELIIDELSDNCWLIVTD